MPVPNATGTQGSSRPAPASARAHCAQRLDERRPEAEAGRREAAGRRRRARRPGPGIAPLPARRVALLRHAATPYDPVETARLPDACMPAASGTDAETWKKCTSAGITLGHPGIGRRSDIP